MFVEKDCKKLLLLLELKKRESQIKKKYDFAHIASKEELETLKHSYAKEVQKMKKDFFKKNGLDENSSFELTEL